MRLRSRPDELDLHMRLAKVYVDQGKREDAIAELDAIGELQLGMGRTQDARRTIQAIIRLGPDNVDGYRQLLAQLQSPVADRMARQSDRRKTGCSRLAGIFSNLIGAVSLTFSWSP